MYVYIIVCTKWIIEELPLLKINFVKRAPYRRTLKQNMARLSGH